MSQKRELEHPGFGGLKLLARWMDEKGTVVGPDLIVRAAEKCCIAGALTALVQSIVMDDFAVSLYSRELHTRP
jgi:sensor c-di-GMP phosphodiesterase-like protein